MSLPKRAKLHPSVDPAVKEVHALYLASEMTVEELASRLFNGANLTPMYNWFHGRSDPGLSNIRAALNVFGYDLKVVKKDDD